jgi:hypothetical protein
MKQRYLAAALVAACALGGLGIGAHGVKASDHDDGSQGTAQKNHGLTDLYVFREKDQNPSATGDDLIFIMNTNPRSEGGKQYYFATDARYEFHVSAVANNAAAPTAKDDVILRFEFGEPDAASKQQAIAFNVIKGGDSNPTTPTSTGTDGKTMVTTPLGAEPISNTVKIVDKPVTIFAGMREDPFFFDVDRFLEVRASAAARAGGDTSKPQVTFRNPGVDFTAGLNVNAIVARVPKSLLPGSGPTYDVWQTISVKK